ncbi:hypothetical protein AVEN_215808-1 [Araneus ventricosus]|uniref:Uncharacterized protein n=1 Tax=Araneus ventricosus TaxID=182803 RepID=A0A4Y2KVZ3_ARAVE|nr:hypothetical protein AVEN_215808-1 [Araneus ventricosus]
MNRGGVSLVNREVEYSPYCFVAAYISPNLILVDFICVIFSTGEFKHSRVGSTYLQTYLIDFTELQYSMLIRSLKIFVNKGQHGTIQAFSADTSNPRKLMFAVNSPACEDLRRYSGYPFCPDCVCFKKKYAGIALCKFHLSCMENVDL